MSQYSAHNEEANSNVSSVTDTANVTKANSGMRQSAVNELKRQSYLQGPTQKKADISGFLMAQPFEYPEYAVYSAPTHQQVLAASLVGVSASLAGDDILNLNQLTAEQASHLYASRADNDDWDFERRHDAA